MSLSLKESEALFGRMLDGDMGDAEIKATLIEMAERDETSEEIAGAIRAMRARMVRVSAPEGAIDVCGTGGDGAHSLNVSTAVAIVVAACEVPVAKHGNRAASSKAGGADTLEALGLNLDRAAETAEQTLADLGIAFLFAQKYHPALGRLAPIRREIGRRTIFNLCGPACNPAGVTRQLIGVARPDFMPVYAGALELLVYDDAMLVAGDEPLDELSISGPSSFIRLGQPPERIAPEDAGLPRHPPEALKGGDAHYNADALRRLLSGTLYTEQDRAYRDATLFNAAAALIVAGHSKNWRDGVEEAGEAIDKGLAKALLECWVRF
ncbi:anthranilate phosphoribosyltransferase [Sphingorhabdus pulchriflava]|uniref:Anthranilate phosphoribosyltransferase n=2 Tax=Sphingorhabdus pulchriflava TaxID=2292257 RepID=A0A371BH56_9SPHN|nr:anthranilate phosphoribosyltransferase [Sphingorhabdus pulchriflava]RDV06925.1 anthranilate phosphoribosyltransferase [Sphingorhabdus pulchriflava]